MVLHERSYNVLNLNKWISKSWYRVGTPILCYLALCIKDWPAKSIGGIIEYFRSPEESSENICGRKSILQIHEKSASNAWFGQREDVLQPLLTETRIRPTLLMTKSNQCSRPFTSLDVFQWASVPWPMS